MRDALLNRRTASVAAAVTCLLLAAVLGLFAVDVARWREAVPAGDVRYRVSPETVGLWEPSSLVSASAAEALLGYEDDVDFRRAVRSLRVARLDDPVISDPRKALALNEAQARLEAIASQGGDSRRRSRAAGLLGVLGLSRLLTETQDRAGLLQSTIANLEFAIGLDPGNDEAKFNLELALQQGRGLQIDESAAGGDPRPGGAGSKGAGAGDPGSGY
jgi:hypothetical protein